MVQFAVSAMAHRIVGVIGGRNEKRPYYLLLVFDVFCGRTDRSALRYEGIAGVVEQKHPGPRREARDVLYVRK